MKPVTIAIITSSEIIAAGLSATLQRLRALPIGDITHITPTKAIQTIPAKAPRLIIIDPLSLSTETVAALRDSMPATTVWVAINSCAMPADVTRIYDYTLSIYDNTLSLSDIISKLGSDPADTEDAKILSQREKEVVVGIVKGLSNKEIAAEMHVSVNTVMTHRRNITSKLQIHSAAGLTIYAIVSKLVRLDEISTQLPI